MPYEEEWIGVDLDGTLAFARGWRGVGVIGEPIPRMLAHVKQWLDKGKRVKIFAARGDHFWSLPFYYFESNIYIQVTLKILKIDRANGDLMIPAGTLLFTSGKSSVGVVRPNGTVEIRTIAISRDLGSKLEISRGLSESDQIVGSPPPWPCGRRRRQRPKMKPCTKQTRRQDDLFKENKTSQRTAE
jgi:hypothetical protein